MDQPTHERAWLGARDLELPRREPDRARVLAARAVLREQLGPEDRVGRHRHAALRRMRAHADRVARHDRGDGCGRRVHDPGVGRVELDRQPVRPAGRHDMPVPEVEPEQVQVGPGGSAERSAMRGGLGARGVGFSQPRTVLGMPRRRAIAAAGSPRVASCRTASISAALSHAYDRPARSRQGGTIRAFRPGRQTGKVGPLKGCPSGTVGASPTPGMPHQSALLSRTSPTESSHSSAWALSAASWPGTSVAGP